MESGPPAAGTDSWDDPPYRATVNVQNAETCTRTYELSTTAPLRDGLPQNPRIFSEKEGQPIARTGQAMLDALYALAIEESREASVDAISDGSFNGGNSIPCEQGGCFETGRLWKYVWTRDTAYSMALGLGTLDPFRARTSLTFKLSTKRDGTGRVIVQDTGTGGSWPISSDRVVWAMGAMRLLEVMDGPERETLRDLAYEAITNTAERDRLVVWDSKDGLYRGEQSFLDWREQTYPNWTATDAIHIGMSKALGTNIGHLALLEAAAELATEKNDAAASQKYAEWATQLRSAIRSRLWLADRQMYSTFVTTYLDPAPTLQYDLLGSALAVLYGIGTEAESAEVVARYPHLPKGAPVIWPQQRDVRIYHNRAIWPFVTAFWAKAAARVKNADAVDHAMRSLVRGAALNLSHMENFEAVTGAAYLEEGATSGPVVNSQRQLWSVAGFVSLVHDVFFGFEATQSGVRFAPQITRGMRRSVFGGKDRISLWNLVYKGKRLSVTVNLPMVPEQNGMLEVVAVRLNGQDIGKDFIAASMLGSDNHFDVDLGPGTDAIKGITLVDDSAASNVQNLYGPRTPNVTGPSIVNDRVQINWTVAENANDVTFNVYRDGTRIAENLAGSTLSLVDPNSAGHATTTYCYAVEAVFKASGNASQRSKPVCYWGPNGARIQSFGAQSFQANGGTLVFNHQRWHYENWGDPGHTLTIMNVKANQSGRHLLEVEAGNGAGNVTTGITCGVKAIEVWDGGTLVGGGQLMMPHPAAPGDPKPWEQWRASNFVPVDLLAGKTYTVVIREDAASGNMSDYAHFAAYNGMGGQSGRFNKVNISLLQLLAMGGP
jgi:hypothetical protein